MSGLGFGISESWNWNKSHCCHFTLTPSSSIMHTAEERCSAAVGSTLHFVLSCGWGACQKPPKKDPSSDYRGLGKKGTWTWMDTGEWTDSRYCAFAEPRAAQVISAVGSRQSFALTPLAHPTCHPKLSPTKWYESTRKWCKAMSSPCRRNSCLDPRGPVKRPWADVIRLRYLLFHCSRPARCVLIRPSQTSQWRIDFPAPLLQLSQSACQTDWRPFLITLFLSCSSLQGSPQLYMQVKNIIRISFLSFRLFFFSS